MPSTSLDLAGAAVTPISFLLVLKGIHTTLRQLGEFHVQLLNDSDRAAEVSDTLINGYIKTNCLTKVEILIQLSIVREEVGRHHAAELFVSVLWPMVELQH